MAPIYEYKPKYIITPEKMKYAKFIPNSLDAMDSAEFDINPESRNYSNKVNLPIRKEKLEQTNDCSRCKHLERIINFYHIAFIVMLVGLFFKAVLDFFMKKNSAFVRMPIYDPYYHNQYRMS